MKVFENPLEMSVSLLTIAVGVLLPVIDELRDNDLIKMLATSMAVFGGALLSKSLSSNKKTIQGEKEKWKKHYHDRISPINRHLASLTKEVSTIIRSVNDRSLTSSEGIKLIDQLTPNLLSAMTDIGDVLGEKFEPSTIFETAQQVEELSRLLRSLDKVSGSRKQRELVEEVKEKIAIIHPDVYKTVDEIVKCPYCNFDNDLQIGKMHPASAARNCIKCEKPFHAHRGKDNQVFTSLPGSKIKRKTKHNVTCKCGANFDATIKGSSQERVCYECGAKIVIDENGLIIEYEPRKKLCVDHNSFSNGKLTCHLHDCSGLAIKNAKTGGFFAICREGMHLLEYNPKESNT